MRTPNRQFNVRVTYEAADLIEAAVYVRRLRSPQGLLAPVLEEFAASLADDDAIATAMQSRAGGPENAGHRSTGSKKR
jgi:hypothetical protein